MLDTETAYYNKNRHKLRELYKNKYIVIVGKKVVGVYDSHAEAYAEARKDYDIGVFLICNTALSQRL